MWLRKIMIGTLLVFSLVAVNPRPVFALEPITDALLDKADSNAKDVIARAEAAGNSVAKAIGEQALKAIQALREAVHSSIGDARDAFLQSERKTYDDINTLIEQAQDLEKVSMTDVTTLLATVSNEVGNLPFVNLPPAVMLYQPHVLVPDGPSEIPVRVIGPKLAASEPVVTFKTKFVQLQKSRDVELIALLDRKTMDFDEKQPHYVPVSIQYDQAEATWWKPWTWFGHDNIQRDMTLLLLPKTLGSFSIETKLNKVDYKFKDISRSAGGHGKDNSMDLPIRPDPPDVQDGWKIDVTKITKDGLKFSKSSGDGEASCAGLLPATLTPDGFSFRLQHGHKTDWAGHQSDVDVQCAMTVPLVKATPIIVPGPTLPGDIGWSKDVRQPLPADLASYVISLKLFNSKEFFIDADNKVPLGIVEITRAKDYVQFRPKPPSDF